MNSIVGIGELLWDVYTDGRKVAGGAPFNFAFHCHQLGHEAVVVSRVGDDDLGRELRDEVKRLGLSDEFIQTDHEHLTGTVTVSLDEQKVPTYTINEHVAWDFIEFAPKLALLAEFSAAMCFGTLAQRAPVSRETIQRFLISTSHSCRVFDLNFRQSPIDTEMLMTGLRRSDWIKMNEQELSEVMLGLKLSADPGRAEGIRVLEALALKGKTLLITRGSEGCEVFQGGKVAISRQPAGGKVADTTGAGDAFTAAMVCLHLEGKSLEECARFATRYAAKVCEFQGATPRIDRAELERDS